jgi:hypothetical protein
MRIRSVGTTRMKVATAVALATVLGMTTLAAATPGRPDPTDPTVETAPGQPKVDPVPDDAATPASPDSSSDPTSDDPADAVTPDTTDTATPAGTCLTHGERVSAVAHSTPPGPGHGAAVSAVAHDHNGECTDPNDATGDPVGAGNQAPPASSSTQAGTDTPEPTGQNPVEGDSRTRGTGHNKGHGNGKP